MVIEDNSENNEKKCSGYMTTRAYITHAGDLAMLLSGYYTKCHFFSICRL